MELARRCLATLKVCSARENTSKACQCLASRTAAMDLSSSPHWQKNVRPPLGPMAPHKSQNTVRALYRSGSGGEMTQRLGSTAVCSELDFASHFLVKQCRAPLLSRGTITVAHCGRTAMETITLAHRLSFPSPARLVRRRSRWFLCRRTGIPFLRR